MKDLKQLREKRGQLAEEMKNLLTLSESEKRDFTEAEETRAAAIESEMEQLNKEIVAAEKRQERQLIAAAGSQSPNNGMSQKENRDISKYDYMKVLRMSDVSANVKREGLEYELHQEALIQGREAGVEYNGSGIIIPSHFIRMGRDVQKRAHTWGTDSEGGFTVATEKMDIIPYLNVQPVVGQLGATTMANLSGKVSFPRNSNAITMGWKTEGSASDEKSLTFDEVTLTAKELTGHGVLSNSLLRQSTNMSSFVQQTFQNAIAIALDAAAINGSGSAGQPTGILNTSGIGSVVGGTNGAVPDWTDVVDLLKEVEIDNALLENLHYLSTPQIKALFSRTGKQSSGVEGNFIMTNPKELNGYPFTASNNVPSTLTKGTSSGNCHAIIFGNFAELMIGTWGGVEIMVNPYSLDTTRQTRITVSLFADIAVRHAQSFAAMKDALLS